MRELSKAFLAVGIALFGVAAFGPTFLAWLHHNYVTSLHGVPWVAIGIWLDRKWWMLASIVFVTLSLIVRARLRRNPHRNPSA